MSQRSESRVEELKQNQGQEQGRMVAGSVRSKSKRSTIISSSHDGHWSKTDWSDLPAPLLDQPCG